MTGPAFRFPSFIIILLWVEPFMKEKSLLKFQLQYWQYYFKSPIHKRQVALSAKNSFKESTMVWHQMDHEEIMSKDSTLFR